LGKSHKSWKFRTARLLGLAASVFLVIMMGVTVVDVLSRHLFAYPIFGTLDIVELAMVATIFIAIPATFLNDEHIVVDVIDQLVPVRAVLWLKRLSALITLVVLGFMLWYMREPFLDKLSWGETTLELSWPRWWHWLPILFGMALSIPAVIWVAVGLRAPRDARAVEHAEHE